MDSGEIARSRQPSTEPSSTSALREPPSRPHRVSTKTIIRWGIWTYVILWLIEGGLRRWVLPGLATPLLIVRDPVVLGIYALAIKHRYWPNNIFTTTMFVLAPVSWALAVFAGHQNVVVATYGVRCDFMHVPLIFIFAKVINRRDLDRLCRLALWISVPYTLLMIAQFYSPQSAWVNRGVGGDLGGAGFSGALGRFRPPGTFSFITGPAQLYPLLLACWFFLLLRKKLPALLMVLSAIAILIAVPISISRLLLFSELLVGIGGVIGCLRAGLLSPQLLMRFFGCAICVIAALAYAANYTDALDAFAARWENSTTSRGGVEDAIVGRVWNDLCGALLNAPVIGYGTGISTQVGQRVATGTRGFGYSEGEWGRILAEGGILLGTSILCYRLGVIAMACYCCIRAAIQKRAEALGFLGAAIPFVVLGQWGQATTLGSSIIATGLCLAASKRNG